MANGEAGHGFTGTLPYDQDMKAQVAGMDLPVAIGLQSFVDAMTQGIQDARASQRRLNAMADEATGLVLSDARAQQSHQFAIQAAAGGSRQDTLSTTEQEQRTADKTLIEAGLPQRLADLGTVSAHNQQVLDSVLVRLNELSLQILPLAHIWEKLAQNVPPRGPEAPVGSGGNQ